jgi:hypothetical protein
MRVLGGIPAPIRSMQGKLYHLGFRGKVARSTLADANESHDWRITAVRLNVEEKQLVNVFGGFGICLGDLKSA